MRCLNKKAISSSLYRKQHDASLLQVQMKIHKGLVFSRIHESFGTKVLDYDRLVDTSFRKMKVWRKKMSSPTLRT